jgi:hypothetical protein
MTLDLSNYDGIGTGIVCLMAIALFVIVAMLLAHGLRKRKLPPENRT